MGCQDNQNLHPSPFFFYRKINLEGKDIGVMQPIKKGMIPKSNRSESRINKRQQRRVEANEFLLLIKELL